MSHRFARISRGLIVLMLPILIIGASLRLLTTDGFIASEYHKESFPADPYGFSTAERIRLASTNVHYVRAHVPADALSHQSLGGLPLYSTREVAHMADVRAVFQAIFRTWQAAVAVFLLAGLALWRAQERTALGRAIRAGGILTAGLVVSIGLMALFAWQT